MLLQVVTLETEHQNCFYVQYVEFLFVLHSICSFYIVHSIPTSFFILCLSYLVFFIPLYTHVSSTLCQCGSLLWRQPESPSLYMQTNFQTSVPFTHRLRKHSSKKKFPGKQAFHVFFDPCTHWRHHAKVTNDELIHLSALHAEQQKGSYRPGKRHERRDCSLGSYVTIALALALLKVFLFDASCRPPRTWDANQHQQRHQQVCHFISE